VTEEMTHEEAAAILTTIADRQEAQIGDIEQLDYDARKLLESSGDLEVVAALRLGAEVLRESAASVPPR
jgi:hypothetical protein